MVPLPAKEFCKILATFYGDVLNIFRCYSSILSSLFVVTLSISILHPRSIVHSSLCFSQSGPGLHVVGCRPFLEMKLSWDGSPEFVVRTMLDCGANVPVVSQALVEVYKIPRVLRSHTCGIAMFDGQLSNSNAGRAYTQS